MIKKGSKLYSILWLKCPVCHEDGLFPYKLYNLKKIGKMEASCSSCGTKYAKEPGFYYGAAYVSYAITVAFAIAIFLMGFFLMPTWGWMEQLISVIVGLIVLFPVSFALSRSIWLNMFFSYGKKE